nr:MAG TPA: hypothetical protein [Caudoviricetes sp.]
MFEASAMRIMIFQLSTIDNCLILKGSPNRTAFKAYCCSVEELLGSDSLELELDSDSAGCSSL